MENSSTRLVVYSTLMTLGVLLVLLGISWLMFLGMALIMLAIFSSSQDRVQRKLLRPFLVYAAMAVISLFWDFHNGDAFDRRNPSVLFWLFITAFWLWAIADEFRQWRKRGA